MNKKLTQTQLGVINVFALTLALTSPAFAQCSGGVCRVPAQTSYAVRTTSYNCSYNCSYNYSYNSCGTFAPFGGFFRGLFGCQSQSRSCAAASPCARLIESGRAQECATCSGETCLADPVDREKSLDYIDAETGKKYVFVPGDESFPPAWKEVDSESCEECEGRQECEECEPCEAVEATEEPCGAVRATWLEKKLFDCANAQRRANGLRPFLFDGRLIQWARFNSSLQARYCRLGHFSGYGAEIAGEGYTTPEAAVQGWLGSAPHRVILLNGGYTRCGCACYQGANGRYYWTMSFGN